MGLFDKFSWDPTKGSAMTGAGLPWGPRDYADPAKPKYVTDPNQMPGYDYAPMMASMEQSLREQGARQQQGNRASLVGSNPYGGSQGSAASKAYGQTAAGTQAAINQAQMGLAKQAYDERVAAMQAQNAALRQEYELALQRSQREEDQRSAFHDKLSTALTAGLGS
jgi:hypothetical protein